MKKYIIFDLDWTLISSIWNIQEKILKKSKEFFPNFSEDEIKYFLFKTNWASMRKYVENFFENKNSPEIEKIEKELHLLTNKEREKINFEEWVVDMVKRLSKDFTLFLSTWAKEEFAIEALEKWWLTEYFKAIRWSDFSSKEEHVLEFSILTEDLNFFKKCFSVWDWFVEEEAAKKYSIDFIKIWENWKSEFEVGHILEVEKVVKQIKK